MNKPTKTTQKVVRFRRWTRKNYGIFAMLNVTIGVLAVGMSILAPATSVKAQNGVLIFADTLRIEDVEIVGSKHSPTRTTARMQPLFNRQQEVTVPVASLEDALRLNTSIDLRERGGKGVQADISIRGGSEDQTMVMLNGINFTDARTGHQSHSLPIDIDCIGSIELLEGISGVGAYAGAVNIRTAPLYPTYLRLSAECGQNGYFYSNLSGALFRDKFSLFGAASYRRSDGYMANTDFENVNGYIRANYEDKKAGFFDIQVGVQHRSFGSNGFYAAYNPNQYERTATALGSVRWVKDWNNFRATASIGYRKNFDRYDWVRRTSMNLHTTDNISAEVWGDYRWRAGISSIGGDYAYNAILSTNLGRPLSTPKGKYDHADSRHVGNIWLRHIKSWRRFDVAASIGASYTPYGIGALWSATGGFADKGWSVRAGVEQSMRLPTFTDLYYTSPANLNNLNLKPEQAITCHISGGYSCNNWSVGTKLFYRDGRNVIDWVWRDEIEIDGVRYMNKWHSEQESQIGTFGIEVNGGWTSSKNILRRATIAYGYLTKSQLRNITTASAMDYMRHKLAAIVEVSPLKGFSIAVTGTLFDRNGGYNEYLRDKTGELLYDDNGKMVTKYRDFRPYFLLDARLRYEAGPVAIHLDLSNITNTNYCDFGGIRRPGFWLTGGVTFTILKRGDSAK